MKSVLTIKAKELPIDSARVIRVFAETSRAQTAKILDRIFITCKNRKKRPWDEIIVAVVCGMN